MNKAQPKPLFEFWKDEATRDNVHEYLKEFFGQEGLRRLFNREDAVAVADAVELLDRAFEHMNTLFEPKVGRKNTVNEAR